MRSLTLMIIVLIVSLSLAGCGGSKTAEPEKGSLLRSYKLVDDMGRESGTLTLTPQGGAELRDADGQVIGTFMSGGTAPTQAAPAPEAASAENPAPEKEGEETGDEAKEDSGEEKDK